MTKEEAAIVSAYTGYLIGDFSYMAEYCERIMDMAIFTHQYPEMREDIRAASKADFVAMSIF